VKTSFVKAVRKLEERDKAERIKAPGVKGTSGYRFTKRSIVDGQDV
jgi:hypothetical protein